MAIAGKVGLTLEGAWVSTKQYDRLTGVEYNNNLYISKKMPPIGEAPADGEYWMLAVEGIAEQAWKNMISEMNKKLADIERGEVIVGKTEKLAESRSIQVNLSSDEAATFDGSGNAEPGVKGVLPLNNGGTGGASASEARNNLGLGAAATKDVTSSVVSGGAALVTSGAVYSELEKKLSVTGTAAKATADADGNNISNTYAKTASLGTQVTYTLSGTTLTITTK